MYESEKPELFCFNLILFYFFWFLVYNTFRKYHTYDELLRIILPEEEMFQLHWKKKILETPFFINESIERIKTVDTFNKRLRSFGLHIEYPESARNHDFRTESLY